jgi:hypothetical protein
MATGNFQKKKANRGKKSAALPSVKVQVILGMLPSGNNQKHSLGQIDLFSMVKRCGRHFLKKYSGNV